MAVLYLTETDVDQLLDIKTAIAVCEDAFRQLAAGHRPVEQFHEVEEVLLVLGEAVQADHDRVGVAT